jgi:hypothetical protein
MVSQPIWIAIVIVVFFVGIGVSYAHFTNTYDPMSMKFHNQELFDQMMSHNPKMSQQWMDSGMMNQQQMMNDPQMQQQMMNMMMQNPDMMNTMMNNQQMMDMMGSGMMNQGMMGSGMMNQGMNTMMSDSDQIQMMEDMMEDMMERMQTDPELKQAMMKHMERMQQMNP